MMHPKGVCLIAAYFGPLPTWMPAFLRSCAHNSQFDFLLVTDQTLAELPENVYVLPATLQGLSMLASNAVGLPVSITRPYKVCDLRPIFGLMFREPLSRYDYWGHIDLDVIWGDLWTFFGRDIQDSYDVISSRNHRTSGHLTIYRNTQEINSLALRDGRYYDLLSAPASSYFDEVGMTALLTRYSEELELRLSWSEWRFNFPPEKRRLLGRSFLWPQINCWRWIDGHLLYRPTQSATYEVPYIHFMTWKSSISVCEVCPSTDSFWISFTGFSLKPQRLLGSPVLESTVEAFRICKVNTAQLVGAISTA